MPLGTTVDSGSRRGQCLTRLALRLLPIAGSLVGQRLVHPAQREGLTSPRPPRQVPLPHLLVRGRPDHPAPAPRREGYGGAGQTCKSRGPTVYTPYLCTFREKINRIYVIYVWVAFSIHSGCFCLKLPAMDLIKAAMDFLKTYFLPSSCEHICRGFMRLMHEF